MTEKNDSLTPTETQNGPTAQDAEPDPDPREKPPEPKGAGLPTPEIGENRKD